MIPMRARVVVLVLLSCSLPAPDGAATAQRAPVPVLGRTTEVTLLDGSRLGGELLESTDLGLLLGDAGDASRVVLSRVDRVRVRQHDFGGGKALAWIGIGALVSGVGLAAACSQVDGASCGGVLPGVALSFGLIGGLFSLGITSSGWREVPVDAEALRAYARFPQGAPPGFESER
jgi:hypothetical protein